MSDQGTCEWCGGPIPPRPDPRGQRARFCCPAHRAAAHRARTKAEHADELEAARAQMTLPVEPATPTPEQRLDDAAETLEAVSVAVDRGALPAQLPRLLIAAQALVDSARRQGLHPTNPPSPAASPQMSRKQRRAAQRRRAVRKSGQ